MSIDLLVGKPRSGKTYEAVVFHIIPTLLSGRKVITNIPLNLEYILKIHPQIDFNLIEIRKDSLGSTMFSQYEHYADTWRSEKNQGALYVIDECHKALPIKTTRIELSNFYAEHGHFGIDILLITQYTGKINKSIIAAVQVCYKIHSTKTLGISGRYIRKVYDGVGGACTNTSTRKYESNKFKYYKSHSHSLGSVHEASSRDITPIYFKWPFMGLALMIVLIAYNLIQHGNPFKLKPDQQTTEEPKKELKPQQKHQDSTQQIFAALPIKQTEQQYNHEENPAPYSEVKFSIIGYLSSSKKSIYRFSAIQQGREVFQISSIELQQAGYKIKPIGSCNVELIYQKSSQYVLCNNSNKHLNSTGMNLLSQITPPDDPPTEPTILHNFETEIE